jgi:hypothetical protein
MTVRLSEPKSYWVTAEQAESIVKAHIAELSWTSSWNNNNIIIIESLSIIIILLLYHDDVSSHCFRVSKLLQKQTPLEPHS